MNNMKCMKRLVNVSLIIAVFCIKNSNSKSCEETVCYKTNNVLPKHYNIQLTPNMKTKNNNFEGNLVASFEILQDTHNFTMNSLHLIINETATLVRDSYNKQFVPIEHRYDNIRETLTLHFKKKLLKGNYVLAINFTGASFKDIGFYTKSLNTSYKGLQM